MYIYFVKLKRVVDGDTIDCSIDLGFDIWHEARVRMMGIDTPESRTRNLEEKALGLASKQRLKELLTGRQLKLVCSKEGKGKFGRVLADVISIDKKTGEEFNVNNRLIEEGFARPYYGGKKTAWV
jgi:micrococcal nuclease